jgi:hypothetical protein
MPDKNMSTQLSVYGNITTDDFDDFLMISSLSAAADEKTKKLG